MTIREYLDQVAPTTTAKVRKFYSIQEAEDSKAITKEEANQLAFMVTYGEVSNLFKEIK